MNDLLQRAKSGDLNAFAELFEPLRPELFAVCCRILGPDEAEDAVMDTFLKAWQALPGFSERSSLKTWVYRIASNRARDLLRARRSQDRRRVEPVETDGGEARMPPLTDPSQPLPDEQVSSRDFGHAVQRALATLPEVHRHTLLLRYVDGLSYNEAAAAMGVSIGTVMSRLFNGRRKLLRALKETGVETDGLEQELKA